jgi:hypothetical protein
VTNRRETDKFEFSPSADERVTNYLRHLNEAGDGWINLMPGVHVDEDRTPSIPGPFALFTGRQPPVTMCTLVPPKPTKKGLEGVTIGLLHPTGNKAVARLAEAGVEMPDGWVVKQDHNRRGLLLSTPPGAPEYLIVEWAIRAGTALCREEMTGEWQAVVYLP